MSNITQPVFTSLKTNNYKYYDCWISIGGGPPNYEINKLKYDIGHNLSEENKDCVFVWLNEKSVLISLDSSFYHFVAETVSFIAEIYEKDKNTLFIINSGNVNSIDSLSVKFVKSFKISSFRSFLGHNPKLAPINYFYNYIISVNV